MWEDFWLWCPLIWWDLIKNLADIVLAKSYLNLWVTPKKFKKEKLKFTVSFQIRSDQIQQYSCDGGQNVRNRLHTAICEKQKIKFKKSTHPPIFLSLFFEKCQFILSISVRKSRQYLAIIIVFSSLWPCLNCPSNRHNYCNYFTFFVVSLFFRGEKLKQSPTKQSSICSLMKPFNQLSL